MERAEVKVSLGKRTVDREVRYFDLYCIICNFYHVGIVQYVHCIL